MALAIRRDASIKVRIISTLVMAFALVVQPMYGFVSSQVASAATSNVTYLRIIPVNAFANVGESKSLSLILQNSLNEHESLDSDATVLLTSDSPTGQFAKGTSESNPWMTSPSFTLGGGVASLSFRYKDTTADTHTLTATVLSEGLSNPLTVSKSFVVNEVATNPATNPVINVENFNTVDGNYKGISVGFNTKNFGNVTAVTVELTRADDNNTVVTKTANQGVLDIVNNNDAGAQLTAPFIIQQGTFSEEVDLHYWNPATPTTWSTSTVPKSVKIIITDENGPKSIVSEAFTQGAPSWPTYESLLPPAPIAVDPNNQNVQRFSGDVYRDIALDNCDGLDECKNQRTNEMLVDWEMRLYKEDNNGIWQSVRSVSTNSQGQYNFGAVQDAGIYHVCEVLKAGWTQPIQTWNGSGYLVNTPNTSGVVGEGKYCTTTNYTDEKDNSSVSHFGNVDVSAPIVSNISISPRASNGNIGGTVTVTFDLNDAHPINTAKTRILFSDGPNDANRARESVQAPVLVEGNTYKAVFNTKSFVKNGYIGNYNLGFNPYDSLNNQTSSKPASFRNILIDNVGPSIGNKTPAENARIGGAYKVSATVTDQSGVDDNSVYARFRDDAGKEYTHYLMREGDTNVYSKLVDTRTIINKATSQPNRVSFAAEDIFGTSRSSVSDGVVIDNNNPVIQSATFSDTLIDINDGDPTLSAVVDGTGSKVKNVQYRIHTKAGLEVDGFSWVEIGAKDGAYDSENEQAEGAVNIANLADGEYVARVRAFDAIGNKKSGVDVAFVVDRTAPVASITSHSNGDMILGQVTLIGQVDDANPMNTYFKVTGPNQYVKTDLKTDGRLVHELAWDASALPNGIYTVQFETRDQAGNKTTVSTKKINLVVENPQPVVNGENFNTHVGADYKGINVGFNIDTFKTVTGITVDLYDAEGNLLVSNTHNQKLMDLIAGGVKQLSTPFITDAGTYVEEYWNMGARTWTTADKPAKAVITVTGTNNAGVAVTESAELATLTEPNGWTYESVLPVVITSPAPVTDTTPLPTTGAGQPSNAPNGGNINSNPIITGSTFSPLQTPAAIFFAQANGNAAEVSGSDNTDETAVLGTQTDNDDQEVKGSSDNVAAIEASEAGWKFLGVPWYWIVLLIAAIGSVWYLLARRRNQDA